MTGEPQGRASATGGPHVHVGAVIIPHNNEVEARNEGLDNSESIVDTPVNQTFDSPPDIISGAETAILIDSPAPSHASIKQCLSSPDSNIGQADTLDMTDAGDEQIASAQ